MSQARLRTSRLQLVPLSDNHLDHEADLDADPEVMRYLGNGRAHLMKSGASPAARPS